MSFITDAKRLAAALVLQYTADFDGDIEAVKKQLLSDADLGHYSQPENVILRVTANNL